VNGINVELITPDAVRELVCMNTDTVTLTVLDINAYKGLSASTGGADNISTDSSPNICPRLPPSRDSRISVSGEDHHGRGNLRSWENRYTTSQLENEEKELKSLRSVVMSKQDEFNLHEIAPPAITIQPTTDVESSDYELDEVTLQRRLKQIDYGKNTSSYLWYRNIIPRSERTHKHPQTPNIFAKKSRRIFDSDVRQWKYSLHDFAPPPDVDGNVDLKHIEDEIAQERRLLEAQKTKIQQGTLLSTSIQKNTNSADYSTNRRAEMHTSLAIQTEEFHGKGKFKLVQYQPWIPSNTVEELIATKKQERSVSTKQKVDIVYEDGMKCPVCVNAGNRIQNKTYRQRNGFCVHWMSKHCVGGICKLCNSPCELNLNGKQRQHFRKMHPGVAENADLSNLVAPLPGWVDPGNFTFTGLHVSHKEIAVNYANVTTGKHRVLFKVGMKCPVCDDMKNFQNIAMFHEHWKTFHSYRVCCRICKTNLTDNLNEKREHFRKQHPAHHAHTIANFMAPNELFKEPGKYEFALDPSRIGYSRKEITSF